MDMAYKVKFKLPAQPLTGELTKADIEFKVKKSGEDLGTLRVSVGAMVWFPKGKRYGHTITWDRFHNDAIKHKRYEKRSRSRLI